MSNPDSIPRQTAETVHKFLVELDQAGRRLDQFLAAQLPEHSRARLQDWIKQGCVRVDDAAAKPSLRLERGMHIELVMPPLDVDDELKAQPIPLDVLYEDETLLIINKPPGLTVHPGAGQRDGTMQNALLHHRPALAAVPRAGIVHRLDKLTSGVLVVAATLEAHTALVRALQAREFEREYLALVWGDVISGGTVDAPIARHPRDRLRFHVGAGGRPSVTHYRVVERLGKHSLLRLQLETGRTHQIRVHMQHIGFPLVADPLYGRSSDPWRKILGRQALHASRLGLVHPKTGDHMEWEAPLPEDLQACLDQLRSDD